MNRRTILGTPLFSMLALPMLAVPAEIMAQTAQRYAVLKGDRLVLTVSKGPGSIVSTAALPPGARPAQHPFLGATAHAPEEENALRDILDRSTDFDDFLRRLRDAGYTVRPD